MKKVSHILTVLILSTIAAFSQSKGTSVEILYFKAPLPCCHARACNIASNDMKNLVENHYANKPVVFREVQLRDAANAELVKTYNAQSQTVVVVGTKRGKSTSVDISEAAQKFIRGLMSEADFLVELDNAITSL